MSSLTIVTAIIIIDNTSSRLLVLSYAIIKQNWWLHCLTSGRRHKRIHYNNSIGHLLIQFMTQPENLRKQNIYW